MTAPHDRPTAAELLEALHEWMERDLLPGVDGRLQFHTRVAINMIDIVRRELELGPDQGHCDLCPINLGHFVPPCSKINIVYLKKN